MREDVELSGRGILLAVVSALATLYLLLTPPAPAPAVGPPLAPPPCPILAEHRGYGVACLSPQVAATLGIVDGAAWTDGQPTTQGRMLPQRLLLAGYRIDINRASREELIALPDIGPSLAQAIITQRAIAPVRCQRELEKVPGLGHHRVRRLLPVLAPLPQQCPE